MEYHLVQQLEKSKELKHIAENVEKLPLPEVELLHTGKDLQQLVSSSMGLEVEAASCHLKDEDSDESGEFNQPDHALNVFKKKRRTAIKC